MFRKQEINIWGRDVGKALSKQSHRFPQSGWDFCVLDRCSSGSSLIIQTTPGFHLGSPTPRTYLSNYTSHFADKNVQWPSMATYKSTEWTLTVNFIIIHDFVYHYPTHSRSSSIYALRLRGPTYAIRLILPTILYHDHQYQLTKARSGHTVNFIIIHDFVSHHPNGCHLGYVLSFHVG